MMFATKDAQGKAVRDVEQYKTERNAILKRKVRKSDFDTSGLTMRQEALNVELKNMEDSISRAKSRIVQSPERIRKTISVMSTTAIEDKRMVGMHEAKARDLQAKVNALHNIETVSGPKIRVASFSAVIFRMSEAVSSRFKPLNAKSNHWRHRRKP
jgi:kinetochore protein Nuf2